MYSLGNAVYERERSFNKQGHPWPSSLPLQRSCDQSPPGATNTQLNIRKQPAVFRQSKVSIVHETIEAAQLHLLLVLQQPV